MGTGRPTDLDAIALTRDVDGVTTPVTVEDRIIELIGTVGSTVEVAAGSVGIARSTLLAWMQLGSKTRKDVLAGRLSHPDDLDGEAPLPAEHATRCMRFMDRVDTARDRWVAGAETRVATATRPGKRRTVVTRTDARGRVERTETITDTDPDMVTLRWQLERNPASRDTYRPPRTEITGEDGGPITVDVEHKAASVLDMIRKLKSQDTDTGGTDAEPDRPAVPDP